MDYKILPADKYKVVFRSLLTDFDKETLVNFYGPIIGPIATSLYLLLWQDDGCEHIHHHLMTLLKCSNNEILLAREALEAVGLLKTYVKKENVLYYVYELLCPLYPNEFINHPIFGVVLYNNIGEEEFGNIVKKYQKKKIDYSGYEDITKKMDEVFSSESFNEVFDIKGRESLNIGLNSKIDYEQIISSIPKDIFSEKALNKKTKELIDNLSFIYDVDTSRMIEFIRKSINEFGMIDKNELRVVTRKYYQLSNGSLPTIVYRTQPEYLKKASGDNSTRAKVIAYFENTSPYDFLKAKNKGANPTAKELKLIESLIVDLELTPAVVNVLIDFVLRKNNNKLVNAYVETVASQWKRENLKTAEEAMTFAEKEHRKAIKKLPKAEKEKAIVPEWFNKSVEKKEVSEEDKKELDDLMKEFK